MPADDARIAAEMLFVHRGADHDALRSPRCAFARQDRCGRAPPAHRASVKKLSDVRPPVTLIGSRP